MTSQPYTGSLRSSGAFERVADEYGVTEDSFRGWAVSGDIPTGWHLRMFARLCAMEKTVDPVIFGFREESKVARALLRDGHANNGCH